MDALLHPKFDSHEPNDSFIDALGGGNLRALADFLFILRAISTPRDSIPFFDHFVVLKDCALVTSLMDPAVKDALQLL